MHRSFRGSVSLALALSLLPGLGLIAPAHAQLGGGVPGAGSIATGRRSGTTPQDKAPLPEPEAVPGAKPRAPVAPATKSASDLSPNDALFDAINRGDITAARDALSRGADLNAENVLGMTPMELSVDLGRNDISFLLLSMRGEDSGRGSRAVARQDSKTATPVVKTAAKPPARRVAGSAPAGGYTKPITAPKLFANDGGRPLPSAGFLGFGDRQAAE